MADRSITFGAVGDISLSGWGGQAVASNGPGWPFEKLMDAFGQADLLFGNMESVVLPGDYPDDQIDPKGLVTKFDATAALAEAGFDIVNLAQNHILDGGWKSMFHTRDRIEQAGVATAGVGPTQAEARRMRVLDVEGTRVGFLCYCEDNNYTLGTAGPGHAFYVLEDVLADVAAGTAEVDAVVVSIHADLEFLETPSPARRDAFRRIAAAGAAVVLGHHPHVPQGVERIDGSLIAYSLGNCCFEAHTSDYMKHNGPHTAHSFVLLAEIAGGRVRSFCRVPFEIPPP
ncbi:MAG: CapA family protein, partial [Planctomycetota bacterium]